jgi:hypothetical protein
MAFVTFSGQNKSMNITIGGSEINVEKDLYSGWKVWTTESDNAKYLQAFRTFGGDPTSAGQFAPKYFFLLNGWRVYVDGTVTANVDVALNLYVDGGGNPFVLSNNAVVSNLRSDVAVVESLLQDTLDYAGQIVYDAVDGQAGSIHPTGTLAYPVNNSADLQLLMDEYDINLVLLQSDILVTQNFSNIQFKTHTASEFINPNGFKMDECYFEKVNIDGDFDGSNIVMLRCTVTNIQGVYGRAENCILYGTVLLNPTNQLIFTNCSSGIPGDSYPIIDMNPGTPTGFAMRGYSGGLGIINCDTPTDVATVEYIAGKCTIGPTGCTDGYISVRGIALLTDNSSGTLVDTSALYETSSEYNGEIFYDENSGISGATYPTGTATFPVSNCADLVSIISTYKIKQIKLESNITLTENLPNVGFSPAGGVVVVNINGQNVAASMFERLYVYGDFANSYQTVLQNCFTSTIARFNGVMKDTAIEGNISLSTVGETSIIDCAGGNAQETVTIDKLVGVGTILNVRRYSGDLNIINSDTAGDMSTVVMDNGSIILDSSCTNGTIDLGGFSNLTDNSAGLTVNSLPLLNPVVINSQMTEILGLSQSNFAMKNQTYSPEGNLETALVKIYPTATDVTNDTNPIAIYDVLSTYDGSGLLTNYTVKKQ